MASSPRSSSDPGTREGGRGGIWGKSGRVCVLLMVGLVKWETESDGVEMMEELEEWGSLMSQVNGLEKERSGVLG